MNLTRPEDTRMHKLVGIATIAALLAGCASQIDEDNPTGDPTEAGDDQ